MTALHNLRLRELVAGVQENRWSAADVTRACLNRITAVEPQVQAWEYLDGKGAIVRAEATDQRAARREGDPLRGATIAIKDIIDVAGMPTKCGSPIYAAAAAATESANCVDLLARAGAVIVGKTVSTEFAYYTPGKTRNPWNSAHTPGGSSMGSAASVASCMVPAALGTQTNGSIIRPAAFCGIVGFKPSYALVSNHGTLDPWPTLDHTGVFARNVGDVAVVAAVIALEEAISPAIAMATERPRLAFVTSPVWHLAEPSQKEMLASNISTLTGAGAEVEALDLPADFELAHRVHRVIMAFEGAMYFGDLQRAHRPLMSTAFNQLIDEGAALSEQEYGDALAVANRLRGAFGDLLAGYDAILTAPAPGEAPATLAETGSPAFCTLWTLLGVPAITIPAGTGPAGLPLGLQIVGQMRKDDALLSVAAWCESQLAFNANCASKIP